MGGIWEKTLFMMSTLLITIVKFRGLINIKLYRNSTLVFIIVIFLFFGMSFTSLSATQDLEKEPKNSSFINGGQILFSPMYSTNTYLIYKTGEINQTWSSNYPPGESVYMLEDKSILRTLKLAPYGDGAGGGVQRISWEGDKLWDFTYYNSQHLSHHDIEPLPNGNVLIIAWEYKSLEEAVDNGRNPNIPQGDPIKPDHIIEVEPTDPSNGEIVWEWHVWDHLIQDYDPTKDNYGVVEDHPELVDINYGGFDADWLHINSIDYNNELDQILLSVRNFNEIWVIDHSTTTEEASGHTGGNSGKGGDILYRWGNPQAYKLGDTSNQKFYSQHDATWVDNGCPGEGNILVFNNGVSRPGSQYSSVDEIIPPIDDNGTYSFEPGSPYNPKEQVWIYKSENPTDFFSGYVGGAQRLNNGNTIVCDGSKGRFFEVTHEKTLVWEYISPYPTQILNDVFKIYYLDPGGSPQGEPNLDCEGSLSWSEIDGGVKLKSDFKIKNIGGNDSLLNWKIVSYPDWGKWTFNPETGENLTPEDGAINIEVTVIVPNEKKKVFEGYITVENEEDPNDFDIIPVYLKTPAHANKHFLNFLFDKLFFKYEQFIINLGRIFVKYIYNL